MQVSYNKLWKLLIDKNIKQSELRKIVDLSPSTVTKLHSNKAVSVEMLLRICVALNCDFGDIMEAVRE